MNGNLADASYMNLDLNNINLERQYMEQMIISNEESPITNFKDDKGDPVIKAVDYPYSLSLKINNFADPKDLINFTKKVKSMVRNSYEYKLWVNYIRDTLVKDRCVLTGESGTELTIDIHHHPLSLENLIIGIINKLLDTNKSFSSFDIATIVIEYHYKMWVGAIPLIRSLHEKFHNGYLQLPIDLCIGNWWEAIKRIELDDETLDLIKSYEKIKLENINFNWSPLVDDKR